MPNEELKTFINKMRAAGKSDLEITTELRTAGWTETDVVSALNPQSIPPTDNQSPAKVNEPINSESIVIMKRRNRFSRPLIFGMPMLVGGILLLAFSVSNNQIVYPILFVVSQLIAYPGFILSLQGLMWLVVDKSVPPPANVISLIQGELRSKLLAINDENLPFEVSETEGVLRFRWKLVDAKWYEFFSRAGLKEQYTLSVKLRTDRPTANVIEEISSVSYGVGIPLRIGGSSFRGWSLIGVKKEISYGIKDIFPLDLGKLYQVAFNSRQFRGPIIKTILDNGWTVEPCVLSLKLGI